MTLFTKITKPPPTKHSHYIVYVHYLKCEIYIMKDILADLLSVCYFHENTFYIATYST